MKFILSGNSATSSIPNVRILIIHVICMHKHHIFTGRRAFHNFYPLAYSIRTKYAVWLHWQHYTFEFPVHQIIGRITAKTGESITFIRFPFTEKIVSAILLYNTGTVRIYNLSTIIKPRHTIVYQFFSSLSPTHSAQQQ